MLPLVGVVWSFEAVAKIAGKLTLAMPDWASVAFAASAKLPAWLALSQRMLSGPSKYWYAPPVSAAGAATARAGAVAVSYTHLTLPTTPYV